ncbi:MAG: DUF2268 domain-containing protein [Pseudoclavibacter sp.]
MTLTIVDTDAALEAVLLAPEAQREARMRDLLAPMADQFRYFPGEVDLVQMHLMSFGCALDRDVAETRSALARFSEHDAWRRIGDALSRAIEVQAAATPGILIPDLTVLLVPGDVGDAHFMGPLRGFSGNGSATGFISLTVWPTDENLARLEAAAVHELNHNLRYAPGGVVWDPSAVTVGEQVVSEGLADAFARQLYGEAGYTPIGVAHLRDEAVLRKVTSGLGVQGMQNFTAWVHGDASAERFGVAPVGLPTGAGYAAGNRLVDAYLQASGLSAAEALHVPSADIIGVGAPSLGITSAEAGR